MTVSETSSSAMIALRYLRVLFWSSPESRRVLTTAVEVCAMTLLLSLPPIMVGTLVVLIRALRVGLLENISLIKGLVSQRLRKRNAKGKGTSSPMFLSIASTGLVSLASCLFDSMAATAFAILSSAGAENHLHIQILN